jgi:hypothetical protein
MRPIRLYTAFHANLDFSALPDCDRPLVISRCYWPLLSLAEEHGIPIGVEMSARTLLLLEREDPEWLKQYLGLVERGLVEPIASGWAQVVAPLAPVEVNRANLELGRATYQRILGRAPETFFVHEQTFSDGLTPLFEEAGARAVVMEWNNPAACQPALRPLRCRPARLRSPSGRGPILLWNDSIVFQKVQRVAQGVIPRSELEVLVDRLAAMPGAEALCLYGGDVEIFDYRPSRPRREHAGGDGEMRRLIALIRKLASDPRFEMVLPRDVVGRGEVGLSEVQPSDGLPEVELGSAADPIPCKKQPRYNPTRWAVSGRDGFGMNTRCHGLLRTQRIARGIGIAHGDREESRDLVDLWRSDFRTRATEEKIVEFETGIGLATARAQQALEAVMPRLGDGEDLLLANPGPRDWDGLPVEVPIRLAAGRGPDFEIRSRRGEPMPLSRQQVEVRGRHRDGSVRDAVVVLEPQIAAGGQSAFQIVPRDPTREPAREVRDRETADLSTEAVSARFLSHRGAAISELVFPAVSSQPLLGTIAHGSFDEIAYTPDFYSGHVVAVTEQGEKSADLHPLAAAPTLVHSGPIRDTLVSRIETPFGLWRKIHRLYRHHARLDLVHELGFHEARLASLRLGIFTLLPGSFDRDTLRYGAVNGGADPEWRDFDRGLAIAQSRAVSVTVSASSCLGGTEGWVALEDGEKGVLIERALAEAAVVPMLDFAEVDDRFFCRLGHSAAETDETRATFIRGTRRIAFSVHGYRRSDGSPISAARLRSRGLAYRTASGSGVTSGV